MVLQGNSRNHLLCFKNKILSGEPFSLIRPNDGEYLVMTGNKFSNIDNWHYDGKSSLKDDLRIAICKMIGIKNGFVGIPCKDCNQQIFDWYKATFQFQNDTLTYGNVFCNKNWEIFTNMFVEDKLPFHYVGPYKSNSHGLNVKGIFETDEFLVNTWDSKKDEFVRNIKEWAADKSGIFIFSAGPITKIIIPILVEQNPNNTYLDAGSSFDLFMKGSSNRAYIHQNDFYANTVCDFQTGHIQKQMSDISVILTVYKRPHCLLQQLAAIHAQTIQPKEIIILKNFVEGVDMPEIPTELMKNVTIVDSSKNFGVWGRFAIALLANTEYVCVFDDDTIPGNRWFENCMNSMNIREGLYGTVGIRFQEDKYHFEPTTDRFGWSNPCDNITEVDLVGHSWFFKRSWIHYLWEFTPDYDENLKHGEDMSLSFALQKHGIPTLVPPHPSGHYDLYGSYPQLAYNYGNDANATCCLPGMMDNFDNFFKLCIAKGFKRFLSRPLQNQIVNYSIPEFSGGWSYTNKEMRELFKHVNYYPSYSILEFANGDSSLKILDHFKKHTKSLNYTLYPSDNTFLSNNLNDNFEVQLYDLNRIESIPMPTRTYDLILVDGPNGEARSLWYSKLKPCVKKGTLLLVDDFNHYKSFSEELDKNFEYELLSFSDEKPFSPSGEHSWKIVRIIRAKMY